MWRSLLCLGVALGVTGLGTAQERKIQKEVQRGQVVRVDPTRNTIILRSGTGAEAKEFEYRVAPTTKYWGADRRAFNNGLRHEAFREGTQIWYTPGADAQAVSELWLADPNAQAPDQAVAYTEGKIVRVDPTTNMVVVQATVGNEVKEFEYRVDPTTKYWGPDQQLFTTGLRYDGFRPGAAIWFHTGAGERNRIMNEVRFHNPTLRREIRK